MPLLRTLRLKRKHAPVGDVADQRTAVVLAKLDAAVERFHKQIDQIEQMEQKGRGDDDG